MVAKAARMLSREGRRGARGPKHEGPRYAAAPRGKRKASDYSPTPDDCSIIFSEMMPMRSTPAALAASMAATTLP